MKEEAIRKAVRDRYGSIAQKEAPEGANATLETLDSGCGCGCGPQVSDATIALTYSETIGYSKEDLSAAPDDANLGLGCGNPTALAQLEAGEVVLDLGSGGGIDCFLAAQKVGPSGRVIGVDMTPDMVSRARKAARAGGYDNVEFRLGEIEALPVPDKSVDVLISNCVINLSPERDRVFAEAFRVLKPGGRIMISDLTSGQQTPTFLLENTEAFVGCLPVQRDEYLDGLRAAGLEDVEFADERAYPTAFLATDPAVKGYIDGHPEQEKAIFAFMDSIRGGMIKGRKPA